MERQGTTDEFNNMPESESTLSRKNEANRGGRKHTQNARIFKPFIITQSIS